MSLEQTINFNSIFSKKGLSRERGGGFGFGNGRFNSAAFNLALSGLLILPNGSIFNINTNSILPGFVASNITTNNNLNFATNPGFDVRTGTVNG